MALGAGRQTPDSGICSPQVNAPFPGHMTVGIGLVELLNIFQIGSLLALHLNQMLQRLQLNQLTKTSFFYHQIEKLYILRVRKVF